MLTVRKYRVLEMMDGRYDSQEDFAKALGISRVWLSSILNGHESPSTDTLVKMCQLLGTSIDEIAVYPKVGAPILEMTPA